MAKRFGLSLFQSCRFIDVVTAPRRLPAATTNTEPVGIEATRPPPSPSSTPDNRRLRSAPPAVPVASCRPPNAAGDADVEDNDPVASESSGYLWRLEEKWHVVSRATTAEDDAAEDGDVDDSSSSSPRRKKIDSPARRPRRRCMSSSAVPRRPSCSSEDSGWLSSEEAGDDGYACCTKGVVVGESYAVVKRSADPRKDFRRSMAEMVVEKEMYEAAELEKLLQCFLSLNSSRHHPVIISAFSDVWKAVFPDADGLQAFEFKYSASGRSSSPPAAASLLK